MIRRSRPLKLKPSSRRIKHFVHHGDMKYPLIADSRLRISDLQLMNNFSIKIIRNPQSAIQRNLRALLCLRGETGRLAATASLSELQG